jgi:hypothetical protein
VKFHQDEKKFLDKYKLLELFHQTSRALKLIQSFKVLIKKLLDN